MRLIITTMLLFFAVFHLNAQKCNYISNTTSGMDGTRQVITSPYKLALSKENGKVQVWSKLYQDSLVVLAFVVESETISTLNLLDEIELIYTDTEKENLPTMNNVIPSTGIKEKYTIYVNLPKKLQDALREKPVQEIKFKADNGEISFPVKKKGSGYIQQVIECTLSAIE